MILALLDALLRPLLLLLLATCVVVIVAVARDTLSTAYPEPKD